MSALTRLQKATAIVPLAIVSAAWTVSLTGAGASTAAADDVATGTLPDGSTVPTQAIEAPASVSSSATIAPAAQGDTTSIISTASASGIPAAALTAYQRAEAVINSADPSCQMPWQLIAAIGRVESDHGRFAGNTLSNEGVAQPGIFGIALNGKNNTQRIVDTDAGTLDSDTTYDRAVGPMQFIPSTWSVVGVDGDNDGKRNPQDIDDAALASSVYLCSGDDDLSTEQGQRASVYRYNHSNDYVDLVISIMQAYMDGDFTSVPNGTTSAGVFVPSTGGTAQGSTRTVRGGGGKDKGRPGKGRDTAVAQGSSGSTPAPSTTASASPTATPTPTQTQGPAPSGAPTTAPTKAPIKVPTTLPTIPVPTSLPTIPVPTPTATQLPPVLTVAEATAQCVAAGVSTLELQSCIDDLLTP